MLLDFSHHHKLSIPSQSHGTRHLKGTFTPIKESLSIAGYNFCNNEMFALLSWHKELLSNNKRAAIHVTIIQDGGAREVWKQKYAILKFVFHHYRHPSGKKKIKTSVIANIISSDLKWFFDRSGGSLKSCLII